MSVVAAAVLGGAAVSAWGASKAAKSQEKSAATVAASSDRAAQLSYDLGQEELAFNKQQYEESKPIRDKVVNAQLAGMELGNQQAQDYYDYQKTTFRPVEQGLVADAQNFSTEGYREGLARQAAATTERAQANEAAQNMRAMAAMGVNPNSGRFAGMARGTSLANAAQRAGVMNDTRMQAENMGWARRMDAAGLGRNLPTNSVNSLTAGTQAGTAALGNQMAPGTAALAGMNNGNRTIMGGANAALSASGGLLNQQNPWAGLAANVGGSAIGFGLNKWAQG